MELPYGEGLEQPHSRVPKHRQGLPDSREALAFAGPESKVIKTYKKNKTLDISGGLGIMLCLDILE